MTNFFTLPQDGAAQARPGRTLLAGLWLVLLLTGLLARPAQAQTASFGVTGSPQYYTVPAGITRLLVVATGASAEYTTGATVRATVAVTPGEMLTIVVGNQGINTAHGPHGNQGPPSIPWGYNGGGTHYNSGYYSAGGGGTDLRRNGASTGDYLGSRNALLVAGGGGSGCDDTDYFGTGASEGEGDSEGGGGGTPNGGNGTGTGPGTGATQTGVGSSTGNGATQSQGGAGTNYGGDGGGGYYGGGSGSSSGTGTAFRTGGGGGGSSWVMAGSTSVSYGSGGGFSDGSISLTPVRTPAPALTAPADGSTVATFTPTYSGTAPAGSTVRLYVDGSATPFTTTATPGGAFSLAQPTDLAQSSHTVYATAQNPGDVVSVASATNTFTVRVVPTITGFSPTSGVAGTPVTLTGTDLTGASSVSVNGVSVTPTSVTATSLNFVVPAGASTTRSITVTTPTLGTGPASTAFRVQLNVTSTSPAANARTAPTANSAVALTFTEPVTAASAATVRVYSAQAGGRKAGSVTVSGNTASFAATAGTRRTNFKPGETVSVSVPAVRSAGGLVTPKRVYQFTTAVSIFGRGVFAGGSDPAVGAIPYGVAVGDVDGDGDLDLLTANFNATGSSGTVSVRLNGGSASGSNTGAFVNGSTVSVGNRPQSVALGDVDGDGDLDLLTANFNATGSIGSVSVRLNGGNATGSNTGAFANGSTVTVGNRPQSVALGDVDGDGDLDLLTANTATGSGSGSGSVSVRLNGGDATGSNTGAFANGSDVSVGSAPRSVALGDVDGDGDLDLLTANSNTTTVSVRLNGDDATGSNTGAFANGSTVTVGSAPRSVALGDVDGDGDLDLLTANSTDNTVSVRLNGGDATGSNTGGFANGSTVSVGNSPQSVALGDVDGDGDLDLLTANNTDNTVSVRLNGGDATGSNTGAFANGSDTVVDSGPTSLAVGDVDGDGDLDLLTANNNSTTVSVRLNQPPPLTITSFAPSSGPVGTVVSLVGTGLTGATAITFTGTSGNVVSTGFTVVSPTSITGIVVPAGATTGPVTVTTASGTSPASAQSFTVVPSLSSLGLSAGALSPAFDPTTLSYTLTVPGTTTSTTVTPTQPRTAAGIAITVNGTAVGSGAASAAIALVPGSNTLTVAVSSPGGGTPTTTYTVTVTRTPCAVTATAQNVAVTLAANGTATVAASTVNNGSSSTCGAVSLALSQTAFTCTNLGTPVPVTLTVTDGFGGSATANATVTVQDNIAPKAPASGPLPAAPALATANIPEAAGYGVLYQLDVPNSGNFNDLAAVPYTVNNAAAAIANPTRVAYFMELESGGVTRWVWASMNNFASTLPQLGLPHPTANPVAWHQNVTGLNVASNAGASVTTGTGLGTGRIEMWPSNYGPGNDDAVLGANPGTYDFGDGGYSTGSGFGSFQVHNVTAGQTVLAYNAWGNTNQQHSLGIGTQPSGDPDWTFAHNAASYTVKHIYILVPNAGAFTQPATVALSAAGTATLAQSAVYTGATDNCGVSSVTVTPSSFSCADIGTRNVSVAVTDASGNTSTQLATVTVTAAPTATLTGLSPNPALPGATVTATGSNLSGATALTVNGVAATISGLSATGFIFVVPSGATNMGNVVVTAPCGQSITRAFSIAPAIASNGLNPTSGPVGTSVTITGTNLSGATGVSFNGGVQTTITSNTATSLTVVVPAGAITGTVSVTTAGGTSAASTQTFTVTPRLNSLVLSAGSLSPAFAGGTTSYTLTVPGTTTSTTVTPTNAQTSGGTITVNGTTVASGSASGAIALTPGSNTLTVVVNPNGAGTAQTYTVTVTRTPCVVTATARNISLALSASGTASTTAAAVNNGSSSTCGAVTLALSQTAFTCANLGANAVTLTVTDGFGGSSTANATVTVTDATAPTALAQSVAVSVAANGRVYVAPTAVNNGSNDNCAVTNVALSASSFGSCMASAALAFDGNDDYVSIPHNAAYNVTTAITLEAWVKTTNVGEQYITTKSDDSWYLAVNGGGGSAGKVTFYLNGVSPGSGGWLAGATIISDGNWHHVAGTYDGAALRIYVDGVLDASRNVVGTVPAGTSPVYVGSRATSLNWNGSLDEVRIWNTARTAAELALYKDKSLAGTTAGLLAYVDFNDGPGSSTVLNRGSVGGTGTLNNFATATAFVGPGQVPALSTGAQTVTLTVSDKAGNVSSTTATITVSVPTPTLATWTGALDTDWTKCANWQYGTLPSATVSAVLPASMLRYPSLPAGTYPVLDLTLASGATLTTTGTATLQVSGSFANNGGTATLAGPVSFIGSAAQSLGGSSATSFATVAVNKAGGSLSLGRDLAIGTSLTMTSGVLSTGTPYKVVLGSTATLSETETSYVSGAVETTRALSTAGTGSSFGGLGLTLTPAASSPALPGSTLVRRVTGSPATGVNSNTGIGRYFVITPAVDANLNLTLVFAYFDHELNGIAESKLKLFKSEVGAAGPWARIDYASYSAATNTVTRDRIARLSTWTLGNADAPLPVELLSFTAEKQGPAVQLDWRTASEQNSARFEVERSRDGRTFERIGTVAAQGTKASPTSYTFLDSKYPGETNVLYYRLRQVDLDGTASYSPVRAVTIGSPGSLTLYPNPARSAVAVSGLSAEATVEVFDALGRAVARATADAAGTAQLALPAGLAAGVYVVRSGPQAQRLTVVE